MGEKKNINRLFQEKFKDYEVFPEASVWENIEKGLATKKKKRRIIPLWLRFGGAAAILLLLISTGVWFFNQNQTPSVEQPTNNVITNTNSTDVNDVNIKNREENSPAKKDDSSITYEKEIDDKTKNTITKIGQQKEPIITKKSISNNEFVAEKTTTNLYKNSTAVSENTKGENKTLLKKSPEKPSVTVAATNKIIDSLKGNLAIENTAVAQVEKNDSQKNTKVDIKDEIEKNKILPEAIVKNKWSVGSTVAPVFYNSFGNGSPIDPALAANKKTSNNSYSYGVKVNYKLSNKVRLQFGVNTLELGYTTKNVTALISSTLLQNSNTNINTNVQGLSIVTLSSSTDNSELSSSQRNSFDSSGALGQSLSYVEVPLEVKYNVFQKKLGVHLIGGVSTYFLYQNRVSITSFGKTTTLGEASNINSLNFSGNLGIDLDYNISKKLYINVSPMFKYQFNTFSKNAGGFQPYYLGIYTGLNYRF